ncbi:MAG: epimerase [Myxococcota bacterium]
MAMRIVIFGASGLIGQGVLLQALDHPGVECVVSVGRRTLDIDHPKLQQIEHQDFRDFSACAQELQGLDACFWCLGTSSGGMSEADYTRITLDFTIAAAKVLREQSPEICFCFVSGAGTDDTEKGRMMWARVKGKAENTLRRMGFRRLHLFRPGFIQSLRGVSSRGRLTRTMIAGLYPLMARLGMATTNTAIGDAMLAIAAGGSAPEVLDSKAINRLAKAS